MNEMLRNYSIKFMIFFYLYRYVNNPQMAKNLLKEIEKRTFPIIFLKMS